MMIVGIDPGTKGCLADSTGDCLQMPMLKDSVDIKAIVDWFDGDKLELVIVEQQRAFGKGFAQSYMKQGQYYGQILGWLQAFRIPFMTVYPQTWRKAVLHSAKDKSASEAYVRNRYPEIELFKNKEFRIGQCDSICLMTYGRNFVTMGDSPKKEIK